MPTKDDVGSFFEAFYSRFVLRDFFGKVGPGFIFLTALALWFESPRALLVRLDDLNFLVWVSVLPVAWLAGFAVQSFGEFAIPLLGRLICYDPPTLDVAWSEFRQSYREYFRSGEYPDDQRQIERLVVIKEACGNGYVAVLFALATLATRVGQDSALYVPHDIAVKELLGLSPILAIVFALMVLLRRMHFEHVLRQYAYSRDFLVRRDPAHSTLPEKKDAGYSSTWWFVLFAVLFLLVAGAVGYGFGALPR